MLGQNVLHAQSNEQILKLQAIADSADRSFKAKRAEALRLADSFNLPLRLEDDYGRVSELMRFEHGMPVYYITNNLGGAHTISTSDVWQGGSAGLNLDGSGEVLAIWDAGGVLGSHVELAGRVSHPDGSNAKFNSHSTHVGGTMIATGIDNNAHGMANQASLLSFDWFNAENEMATQAALGLQASNHSYGRLSGWARGKWYGNDTSQVRWHWFGDTTISGTIDYKFGFYDNKAKSWDEIAENAPNYLIVKSAGNDRNDNFNGQHYILSGGNWVLSSTLRQADSGVNGFDCIPTYAVAKNILTVGAVNGISNGYSQPSDVVMSPFSGWGPADDGRIKPDLVAKGVSVYSTLNGSNTQYGFDSGTSMASPMVAGSVGLLNQHYESTHNAEMRSASMKALLIHTAHEAGTTDGPDYKFGWGLMNTDSAAGVITEDADKDELFIREMTLEENEVIELRIWPTGNEPLKATMAWTDPAGTPPAIAVNPPDLMLVNDLDMRIIEVRSQTMFSPYVLDPQSPNSAATKGDNFRDNVEQIFETDLPQADCPLYLVQIRHKGQLQNGSQDFSLVITGIQSNMIYVKNDATGNDDGSSWDDAYTNLQDAIDAAVSGDEIWVAKGAYIPTRNGGGRHRHFSLKNCVDIYGGFAGDENPATFPLNHRNLLQNETILHGQNLCYHVVRTYPGIDETAVMDGFTVTGGNADCQYPDPNCSYDFDERGAGMVNEGSPTIRNSTFTGNYAMISGAGMLNKGSSPSLISCTFNANDDPECGGGMTNLGSNPFLINCLFHGNKAITGGGMCNKEDSYPTIINTTISSNYAWSVGGGVLSSDGASVTIKNSIIWDNEVEIIGVYGDGHQIFVGDGEPPVQLFSSLCETGTKHIYGSVVFDPQCIFVDPLFINSIPAAFAPSSQGNYRLNPQSPAIDTGSNAYVPVQQITDIDWNQRIDSLVKIVDLGAYEYPKECAAPKNLAAKQITLTSAELWWTPGGSETSWEIEWGLKGFQQGSGTIVTATQIPYLLSNLSPGTEYDFYIRGICPPSFTSQWSGPATFKTLSPCSPPSNVTVAVSSSDAVITWAEPVPPPQNGYKITVTDVNNGAIYYNGTTPAGTSSVIVSGLSPLTDYTAEIQSDCGNGNYSSWISVNFTTLQALCPPPTGLSVTPSDTEAVLVWTAPVPPPQGFEILVWDVSGFVVFNASVGAGSTGIIIPALAPATTYTAEVRSDCGGGVYSLPVQVTFTTCSQFTVSVPADFEVCIDDVSFTLSGATPLGGTYSGTGVSGGDFDPAAAGSGNHTITYVYTGPIGCSDSASFVITVNDLPAVSCPQPTSVCINSGLFNLSGAMPAGGTYSGPGVSGGMFDPVVAGTGIHNIIYTYTDPVTGCTNDCIFTITVSGLPTVTCPPDTTVMVSDPPIVLNGASPPGGVYTDAFGSVITTFDPAFYGTGNHIITYTYTDGNGCTGYCDFMITVTNQNAVYDFGDAPDGIFGFTYPTLLANNGARHQVDPAVFMGDLIDDENDGQPTLLALGDDNNTLDDEDGVRLRRFMAVGSMARVSVKASVDGFLNAWVDFNQDGDWADAGEQIFTDEPLTPGWNTLSFPVPATASRGLTYSRFRFDTSGGLSYDDAAFDGEVEDYVIEVFPEYWGYLITDLTHVIVVPANLSQAFKGSDNFDMNEGDFMGVFYEVDGEMHCGGAIYLKDGENQVLLANGDDPTTPEIEGFSEGETMMVKVFDDDTGEAYDALVTWDQDQPNSDGLFHNNGLSALAGINIGSETQVLSIPEGWSGISTFIGPLDSGVENMFAPVENKLDLLYKLNGSMYWPEQNINTISQWDAFDGHVIRMNQDAVLEISGSATDDQSIYLEEGLNLIPVLSELPSDIESLFGGFFGLVFVKEVAGNGLYLPDWNINTIGNLTPGNAYFVLTTQAGSVSFDGAVEKSGIETTPVTSIAVGSPWNPVFHTPGSHAIVFNTTDQFLRDGDVIGGFTPEGRCAGVVMAGAESSFALTLYATDPFGTNTGGFVEGDAIDYKLYRNSTGELFELDVVYSDVYNRGIFVTHGFSEVTGLKATATGTLDGLAAEINVYPNPSSGIFNLSHAEDIELIEVMDSYGKLIISEKPGFDMRVDLSDYPTGIYFLKAIATDGSESTHKLIVQ